MSWSAGEQKSSRISRIICMLISSLFFPNSYAIANTNSNNSIFHGVELTLSGGATVSNLSNNNSVAINSNVINTYNANQQTQWTGLGGIGISNVFSELHHINITVGPSFYFSDLDKVQGTEYPTSNKGTFDTLNYQFSAENYAFMLESRFVYAKYAWQPFVVAGIGNSLNRLYSYSEAPTDQNGSAVAAPSFSNYTNNAFAYEIGLGLQRQIFTDKKHNISYNASLGYRYFNFGNGKLGQSSIQTSGDNLKVNTLDTQAIILSLSAEFN